MKKQLSKIILILFLVSTIFFIIACEKSDEPQANAEQSSLEEAGTELTLDDFLYDFDYMMQTMEETFPYFGVAERKLGVDIRAVGRETREKIRNYPDSYRAVAGELGLTLDQMPEMDAHVFWSIIYFDFFSEFPLFAHTFAYNFNLYNLYIPAFTHSMSHYSTPTNYLAFSNATSLRFYEEQQGLFEGSLDEESAKKTFVFRGYPLVTGAQSSKVRIDVIEEDRIAYLNIPNFSNFNYNVMSDLRKLYSNINNYEHLIIDIRDNFGGSTDLWRMLIMKPLWADRNNMPDMPLYAFYKGTSRAKSFAEENLSKESQYSRYVPQSDQLLTIDDMLIKEDLPLLSADDLQELAYGVKFNTSIGNIEWHHINKSGLQNMADYPFDGKIWLLTNGNNYSASALFARHAKEMDFATLVGEPTGGAYSTYAANFNLPNTGIVLRWDIDYLTDSEGRSLNEFPTTPHYNNNPGMDALETVLQLIEEGK